MFTPERPLDSQLNRRVSNVVDKRVQKESEMRRLLWKEISKVTQGQEPERVREVKQSLQEAMGSRNGQILFGRIGSWDEFRSRILTIICREGLVVGLYIERKV